MNYILTLLWIVLLWKAPGIAYGTAYHASSGTGFFVTRDFIVTNAHVVQNCKSIRIRGAATSSNVSLHHIDNALDLAILKSPAKPRRTATLRTNSGVKKGDIVVIIGYPLEHGQTGQYLKLEAKITRVNSEFNGVNAIEFTNLVNKGNSGGPLLDRAGNVIGVVVGKIDYYQDTPDNLIRSSGLAIRLDELHAFLRRHNIHTRSLSTYDIFKDHRIERRAKDYIVNVHCIQDFIE